MEKNKRSKVVRNKGSQIASQNNNPIINQINYHINKKIDRVFVVPRGFETELASEISDNGFLQKRLGFVYSEISKVPVWQEQIWSAPEVLEFDSIKQASDHLISIEKQIKEFNKKNNLESAPIFWVNASQDFHRRSALISENLRMAKFKNLKFLQAITEKKIACFALLDPKRLIYSTEISNSFALGEFIFDEDKKTPPSRAYLKLWELFTVNNIKPQKGERCLDMGSCPGGWTWVLQTIGCKVLSVDKAPLDDKIASLSNIQFLKKDAFKLDPSDVGAVDWFFSDIICDPMKLFELVSKWRDSGLVKNFVCTIKFKGKTDFEAIQKFSEISRSQIFHLHHNKHELTWVSIQNKLF